MGEGVTSAWTRSGVLFAFASLIATLALGALVAQSASAQGPGSEFCDEYPSAPGCETGPTGQTGTTDPGGVPEAAGPTAGIGAPGGGELPFTGYPLTALILLLLILLLLGLAIRAYLAVRDRIVSDRAAGP